MSVINKMLRDLDQRNQSTINVNPVIARRQGQPLWLIMILLLTIGLLCSAIYMVLSQTSIKTPSGLTTAELKPAAKLPIESAEMVLTAQSFQSKPTEISVPARGSTLTQSTITVPEHVPEQTALAEASVAINVAQPETQYLKPTTPTALTVQVKNAPQLTMAVQAEPSSTKTNSNLSVTSREPSAVQSQAKLRQQAMAAEQAGQLQQALRFWQQLQQLAPQDVVAYLAQARLWLQLGQPQQAEASLLQAKAMGIMDADIQLMLAQAAASRQQWLQAEALLPASFALPLHPDYYGLKATALQQLGQHQQAFEWFSELSAVQPQLGKWWLGGAVSLEALERPAEAHQYYLNALQWGDGLSVQSKTYIQQRLVATE